MVACLIMCACGQELLLGYRSEMYFARVKFFKCIQPNTAAPQPTHQRELYHK